MNPAEANGPKTLCVIDQELLLTPQPVEARRLGCRQKQVTYIRVAGGSIV